jgi:hypothetical protein
VAVPPPAMRPAAPASGLAGGAPTASAAGAAAVSGVVSPPVVRASSSDSLASVESHHSAHSAGSQHQRRSSLRWLDSVRTVESSGQEEGGATGAGPVSSGAGVAAGTPAEAQAPAQARRAGSESALSKSQPRRDSFDEGDEGGDTSGEDTGEGDRSRYQGANVRYWGRPDRAMTSDDLENVGLGAAPQAPAEGRFRSLSTIDQESLQTLAGMVDRDKQRRGRFSSPGSSDALPLPPSPWQRPAAEPSKPLSRVASALATVSLADFADEAGADTGERRRDVSLCATAGAAGREPPRVRMRERANTTNSIYVTSTMTDPDASEELACVSGVIHAHMFQFCLALRGRDHPRYQVFNEDYHEQRQQNQQTPLPEQAQPSPMLASPPHVSGSPRRASVAAARVPTRESILLFLKDVYTKAQMEKECLIMSFVYLERLLKSTKGKLTLHESNWRAIVLSCMILASKVFDDLSMWNADFSLICPSFTLKRINELEVCLLEAIKYEVRISASQYARFYFQLRAVRATLGIETGPRTEDHPGAGALFGAHTAGSRGVGSRG